MRRLILGLTCALAVSTAVPAWAMDTKAAGKCVVLGAMSPAYRAKAEAILDTASRTGHRALVNRRMNEEVEALAEIKADKRAQEAWAVQAVQACRSF